MVGQSSVKPTSREQVQASTAGVALNGAVRDCAMSKHSSKQCKVQAGGARLPQARLRDGLRVESLTRFGVPWLVEPEAQGLVAFWACLQQVAARRALLPGELLGRYC